MLSPQTTTLQRIPSPGDNIRQWRHLAEMSRGKLVAHLRARFLTADGLPEEISALVVLTVIVVIISIQILLIIIVNRNNSHTTTTTKNNNTNNHNTNSSTGNNHSVLYTGLLNLPACLADLAWPAPLILSLYALI